MAARRWPQAIAEQVMQLPYTSPWSITSEPVGGAGARRSPNLRRGISTTCIFTTGGSTAVDTALRTALFLNERLGRPDKKIVIAREKGYHGSTFLAATGHRQGTDQDPVRRRPTTWCASCPT